VAAHLLWAYYHVIKRREGAPVSATAKPNAAKMNSKTIAKNGTTTRKRGRDGR
jgi:hypothetical protein